MLHDKWRVNGRRNNGHYIAERKARGRVRRLTNHEADDFDPIGGWEELDPEWESFLNEKWDEFEEGAQ